MQLSQICELTPELVEVNSDGNTKMIKMSLLGQFPEAARKLDAYVKDEQRKSRQRAQREK